MAVSKFYAVAKTFERGHLIEPDNERKSDDN
mgnify:CR=1 FL=1